MPQLALYDELVLPEGVRLRAGQAALREQVCLLRFNLAHAYHLEVIGRLPVYLVRLLVANGLRHVRRVVYSGVNFLVNPDDFDSAELQQPRIVRKMYTLQPRSLLDRLHDNIHHMQRQPRVLDVQVHQAFVVFEGRRNMRRYLGLVSQYFLFSFFIWHAHEVAEVVPADVYVF